jgi:hypothetical protein
MVDTIHQSKQNTTLKDWETKITMHAWKDSSFRQLFLSNPKKALQQINCPFSDQYQVNDSKEQSWTFVLPSSPVETNHLLNSETLFNKNEYSMYPTVFC